MIRKVNIKNFKSIVDLELELGRINVFIGENGCGKTNILEAITFFGTAALINHPYVSTSLLELKGIRVTEPDLVQSAFTVKKKDPKLVGIPYLDEEETYEKRPVKIFINSELGGECTVSITDFDEHSWNSSLGVGLEPKIKERNKGLIDAVHPGKAKKLYIELGFGRNGITSFLNYAPENYFLRRFEEEGQIRPLGIRGEGLFKHLAEVYKEKPIIFKKLIEKLRLISWFQDLEIPKDLMFTERRLNIKDKYISGVDFINQKSANEGFLYLLFYFTLYSSPFTPGFFAIDNIDNALNPKLCAEVVRQFNAISKENGKQSILTTHNPAVLDGLDLEDDEQRLFTIYRNQDGHTVAKRVLPPKKIKGVAPVRLSEAYIRGYLGGLPKNF